MRRIKIAVCLVFVASCVLFGVYMVKTRMVEDHEPPVITCEGDEISVSVKAGESELLKGLTAKDNKDGDITKSIRVSSMSHFIAKGKRTVTYAVFDQANQVATVQRTLRYTDYKSPRIYAKKPLRFPLKDMTTTKVVQNMTAKDSLDGDLTSQIYTTWDEDVYSYEPGEYSVVVQVSNSGGDVCAIPLEVSVLEDGKTNADYPMLKEYIAYTQVGKKIKPSSYLTGIVRGNTEYKFGDSEANINITKNDISIHSNVDYSKPGVYTVEYMYKNESGNTAVTKLFVVVEE